MRVRFFTLTVIILLEVITRLVVQHGVQTFSFLLDRDAQTQREVYQLEKNEGDNSAPGGRGKNAGKLGRDLLTHGNAFGKTDTTQGRGGEDAC